MSRFTLPAFVIVANVAGLVLGQSLFNLTSDPYESSNLIQTPDYDSDSIVAFMEERAAYWATSYVAPSDNDADTSVWTEAGGVTPWDTSDFVTLDIEQKYSYADAPHIVFVLVDDWGWNDLGSQSTYLNWATPTIDKLATEGVLLSNYYTNELCAPSRASLLTGRYALRLGFQNISGESSLFSSLDESEITIAQELKSAGYKTYLVGKWGVGYDTDQHLPTQRGFDYFYGFYNGFADYYTKKYGKYLDLHENDELVTDETELDSDYHAAYLFQSKVESVLATHVTEYPDSPMFLYYAMQLVHSPWEAPDEYTSRCTVPDTVSDDDVQDDLWNYCGMMVMLDEAIANLTCALQSNGMNDNLIMVIASDNGGEKTIPGVSYPLTGNKGSLARGGVAARAIVVSNLLDSSVSGTTYDGLMHVTDWLPTLMHAATDNQWTQGYSDQTIDGVDMWDAITQGSASSRVEIVHAVSNDPNYFCILYDGMKYMAGFNTGSAGEVSFVFEFDLSPADSRETCSNPTPLFSTAQLFRASLLNVGLPDEVFWNRVGIISAMTGLLGMVGLALVVRSYVMNVKEFREEAGIPGHKQRIGYGAVEQNFT